MQVKASLFTTLSIWRTPSEFSLTPGVDFTSFYVRRSQKRKKKVKSSVADILGPKNYKAERFSFK